MKPEYYKTMVGDWINIVSSHIPGAVIQIVPTRFDKFDEEADVEQACQDIIKNIERDQKEKIKNLDLEIEKIRKHGDPHNCLEELTQLRDVRPHLPKYFAMPDMVCCLKFCFSCYVFNHSLNKFPIKITVYKVKGLLLYSHYSNIGKN